MKSNELKFSYSLLLGILTAPALFSGDTFSDFQENALLGNDSAAEDSQDVQGDDFAEDNSLKNALPVNDFAGETTPGDDSPEEALSEEEDLPIEDQTPSFDRDEMIRELFKLVKNGDVEKTGEFFKSQEENIDINEKNDLGNTLLHVAIDRDNEEMIKFLIDRGADAHVKNNHGQTPLDFAIIHRKRGTINLLKRASAPKADEAETQSAEEKPEEANADQSEEKANADELDEQKKKNSTNQLIKLLEKDSKNFEKMQELIEAGADVNAKNNSNWTSLHHATHSGNWSMVQFLIDHHADVNAQTQDNGRSGNAPLHLAAKGRHLEDIAKYLIDNGANLNPRNETSGHRPIHDAVINGNLEMVKLLVDGGADMQPEDYSGWNRPLHHAAQRGFREIAKYMLDHGTDVNVKNHSNLTPLDVARDEEMKKFLRKYKGISGHPKATQPKSFWGSMRQWFKKSR